MVKIIGILFFLMGCGGIYWVGKRAFERRNPMGIEEFNSFGQVIGTKALEGVVKIASLLFIAMGFLGFCLGWGLGR